MRKLTNQVFKVALAWRRWLASASGVCLGREVQIARGVSFHLGQGPRNCLCPPGSQGKIKIGDHSILEQGAVLHAFDGSITLHGIVYLGPYVVIYGHGGVEVGSETLISPHVTIFSSNHKIGPKVDKIMRAGSDLLPTKIGEGVWIGAQAVILGGVTIGDGCVVGAGAVVTKDLPAYSVAMGVPAKVVRSRA